MKINFKSPRYVLPLILLPFICIIFYTYKSSFGKPKPVAQGKDSLQSNVADVSDQVRKSTLDDKLDAYREQYKKADGYTAINRLEDDTTAAATTPSLYNTREKRMLDSVRKAVNVKYRGGGHSVAPAADRGHPSANASDRALAEALNRMRVQPPRSSAGSTGANTDPMQLFRQQMALIDSMDKAHDPQYQPKLQKQQANKPAAALPEKALPVTRARGSAAAFNTILPEQPDGPIRAIVDQDITGYAGSRLRIRLLEDIMAGTILIKQGTYLFAEITGFTGQRVMLSVRSVMQAGQILPVKLSIYDNDGLLGLYVPASAFRDFSKDLGSDAGQGLSLQQTADGNSQMAMSILSRMFESTTTAVGKLIRQNKAKLKYNTLVYLIDPESLKHQ